MKTLIGVVAGLIVLFFGVYFGMKFWGGDDDTEQVLCTQDVQQCPDGSYVSRVAPDCNFAACPSDSNNSNATSTQDDFEPQAS